MEINNTLPEPALILMLPRKAKPCCKSINSPLSLSSITSINDNSEAMPYKT